MPIRNTLSRKTFFKKIGAPLLNPTWSWCAKSSDKSFAIFTVWDDLINPVDQTHSIWVPGDANWKSKNGAREKLKLMNWVIDTGAAVLGVRCVARDCNANTRKIAYFDEKSLLVMSLKRLNDDHFQATITGEIAADQIDEFLVNKKVCFRASVMDDLGDVPEGCMNPEHKSDNSTSYAFKRDRMVREYVRLQAQGKCELCHKLGFLTESGENYLEAHHIIGLANDGPDTVENVIALCPEHHREAHYGAEKLAINEELTEITRRPTRFRRRY